MKKQTHTLTLTVRFDRKCSKAHAARAARDCIHGTFYPTALEDGDPETMKVRSIRVRPAKTEK